MKTLFRTLLIRLLCLLALLAVHAYAGGVAHALTDEDIAALGTPAAPHGGAPATQPASNGPGIAQMAARLALALGVVFALMFGVLWAARKYLPQSAGIARGGLIEILATRPLGQRRNLLLVRAQGKTLLLGVTPQAIQTLTEIEPEGIAWADAARVAGIAPDVADEHPVGGPSNPRGTTSLERE